MSKVCKDKLADRENQRRNQTYNPPMT